MHGIWGSCWLGLVHGLVALGTLEAAAFTMSFGFWFLAVGLVTLGSWALIVAAALAWYFATAMMAAETIGRESLPVGRYRKTTELPGEPIADAVAFSTGLPCVGASASEERSAAS